ncbi:hypothetical protein ACF065_16160 [Streptomyces sp. NPDC015232]|uniref:hypothetical protein n=1 Tax=unclassified Streptomyces TaxID=2593676 RepID=UPI0036FC6614
MVRTRLKLAATLTVVVLALTGFQTSTGGKSGKSKSHSSSGGGCSSSKKKNDDYDYDGGSGGSGSNDSTYTSEPTVTSSPTSDVEAWIVDCVEPAQSKRKGRPARKADTTASLKVVSHTSYPRTFRVVVEFEGVAGTDVDRAEVVVSVDGNAAKTVDVAMRNPKKVGQTKRCEVESVSVQ